MNIGLNNLISVPVCQSEILALKEALTQWILFECPTVVHVDENAPVIKKANVPKRGDGHWETQYAYFEKRMKEG